MAPARMISFIEQHLAVCDVCQKDPDIHDEIAKITEIVLPESKMPKALRSSQHDGDDIEDLDDDMSESIDDDSDDLDDSLDDDDLDSDDLKDEDDLLDPDDI
jgi:hypothetical protein